MRLPRALIIAALAVMTLGAVYLTYVTWLVAGIGSAMDEGEPTGPLNGYGSVVVGAGIALAFAFVTLRTLMRSNKMARPGPHAL